MSRVQPRPMHIVAGSSEKLW